MGLTLIAFIGSVFSPYYARARRRGPAEPTRHCALNVALYGPRAKRWAMTERSAAALQRSDARLAIGPSTLQWRDGTLEVGIDELGVPWPSRIRGRVRLHPETVPGTSHRLDPAGRHRWWPLAPRARVEVCLERPALRWQGAGYLDANLGTEPLEQGFQGWHWSRTSQPDGTRVYYDLTPRDGEPRSLALEFRAHGGVQAVEPPPEQALPRTLWRVERRARSEQPGAQLLRTLEDTPFYARSLVSMVARGRRLPAVHESLDLERFRRRWVQSLLPFRMPRRAR